MKKINHLVLLLVVSICHATLFFLLISDEALSEDPTSYYEEYSVKNISFKEFFNVAKLLIDGDSDTAVQLSFSYINVFAHLYFGVLGALPFEGFVFLNMLVISALTIFILSRAPKVGVVGATLMISSFPMVVYMHFTWRQALAQLLVLLLISLHARALRPLALATSVAAHPLALAALPEGRLMSTRWVGFRRLIAFSIFAGIGYFISLFSTIGTVLNNTGDQSDGRLYLWLLVYALYALPVLLSSDRKPLHNSNFMIFSALLLGYLSNSTEIVGVSRLVTFGSLSMLFAGVSVTSVPMIKSYYCILGPFSLIAYLLT